MLRTARLRLIPATPALARADLVGPAALSQALGVVIHPEWPPQLFDAPAIEFSLHQMEKEPAAAGWWFSYIVHDQAPGGPSAVGIAGYKGKPDAAGSVEIGYSVVPACQRQGIASEAATALVSHAFADPAVTRVVAETLPSLAASIAVLEKNGFRLLGEGSEPGTIRFELTRADYRAGRTRTPPHLRTLFRLQEHLAWADRRAGQALAALPTPEASALELYGHVLGAEAVWLSRLTETPATVAVWPMLSVAECLALAADLDRGYYDFLWGLSPADLRRMVSYKNSAGQAFQNTVEDILLHVCLHGCYHRGQIAVRLRAGGAEPLPTDYIAFVRGTAAATRR